jgi:hypothetical protein
MKGKKSAIAFLEDAIVMVTLTSYLSGVSPYLYEIEATKGKHYIEIGIWDLVV